VHPIWRWEIRRSSQAGTKQGSTIRAAESVLRAFRFARAFKGLGPVLRVDHGVATLCSRANEMSKNRLITTCMQDVIPEAQTFGLLPSICALVNGYDELRRFLQKVEQLRFGCFHLFLTRSPNFADSRSGMTEPACRLILSHSARNLNRSALGTTRERKMRERPRVRGFSLLEIQIFKWARWA
jgi:hypothetical protein